MNFIRLMGTCVVLALAACGSSSNSDGGTSGGTTGGGGDVVSACTAYCMHIYNCSGQSSLDSLCGTACQDYASYLTGTSCSNPTGYFNCLAATPCDGGSSDCATQGGCH
jgi:hypothetical protein